MSVNDQDTEGESVNHRRKGTNPSFTLLVKHLVTSLFAFLLFSLLIYNVYVSVLSTQPHINTSAEPLSYPHYRKT